MNNRDRTPTCTWPVPGIVRAVEGLEAGPMTAASWGCCAARRRPGELLTRGDVCHMHADRGEAERCGVLLGGAPELVRLDEVRPAVYRVAWSLSSAASGRLRRRSPGLGNYDKSPAVRRAVTGDVRLAGTPEPDPEPSP